MKTQEKIISELVGNVCWRPWRGVGPVVFLELGEKFPDKKGGELRKGTYTIGLNCHWQVFKNGELLFNDSLDLKELDQKILLFNQAKLTEIIFNRKLHEEIIIFSNGLEIHTYHRNTDDEWHILTPELECVFYRDKTEIGSLE